MKVFKDTDKQYDAEYHLYEMAEAIKELSKDDLQEFTNASPVFEDAVHLTNKLVKERAKQFEALVQEVVPMQKLSFGVEIPKGNELENILEAKIGEEEEGKTLIVADAPINIPMPRQEYEVISPEDLNYDGAVHILKDSPSNVINFKHVEQCNEFLDYCRESEDIEAYFECIHVVNKNWGNFVWGIKKAKQIDYNLSTAKAEEEESEQEKPIFEEVKDFNNVPTKVVNYEYVYGLPVNIQAVIQRIDLDDCILIPLETFFELQKLLKGSKYYFFQSKNTVTNKVKIIIWKT